ncbi:MAG: RIP metalloprotease RseP [Candidatus Aminicenantes bacterium]|nr:RIP metalloprotease RseP [Candidatus Aminicenantes bacterium]
MGSVIGTIFAFALVFGILVFVHEFGHFFTAKLLNINVEVFSFGYGKRLFGFKRKETDYRVSLIPMGGYVKFSGEDVMEQDKEPAPGDFNNAKRWQRFLVILMGPLMNIFLAIFFMAVINMVGVSVPKYLQETPVIGWIAPDSPAARSDLQVDDVILSINGKKTETWNEVELAVGTKPDKTIEIEVKRDDETRIVELTTESKTRFEMGYAGFFGKINTQIEMIEPNSPADKGGMKPGDIITAVNGEPTYYYKFVEILEANPGNELTITVKRDEELLDLKVTPRQEGDIGKIGILHTAASEIEQYGFFKSFSKSVEDNIELIGLVVGFIKGLITGESSTSQMGGPLEIANISYTAFRAGILALMSFIAFISLQLGIINLFPIPVMDGGQILVLALEGLFRRDFSLKVKQVIMQIGFAIFIFLIVFVILNDVQKRLPNGWNSFIPF